MGSIRRHRKTESHSDSLSIPFNRQSATFSSMPYRRCYTRFNKNGSCEVDETQWFKSPDGFWIPNERSDFEGPFLL